MTPLVVAFVFYTAMIFAMGLALGWLMGACFASTEIKEPTEDDGDPWLFRPHLVVDNTKRTA